MRLIDADDFVKRFMHYGLANGSTFGVHSGKVEWLLDEIMNAPTIDPASLVKRGRWEKAKECIRAIKCGACKEVLFLDNGDDYLDWKFCPNCGTPMGD